MKNRNKTSFQSFERFTSKIPNISVQFRTFKFPQSEHWQSINYVQVV